MSEKNTGEDGINKIETPINELRSMYLSYNSLIKECKYTHEEALDLLDLTDEEFKTIEAAYIKLK